MSERGARFATLALITLGACSSSPPSPEAPPLGGEIVATVDALPITRAMVADVALAQSVPPRVALTHLVEDALLAREAVDQRLDTRLEVAWALRATLGRASARNIHRRAAALGPPTDEEVNELSATRGTEFERPESVHVVHAIVMRPKDAARATEAREIALALATVLPTADSVDVFRTIATSRASAGIEVRVEDLPPFAIDGRILGGAGAMDETFARAAFALRTPGAMSDVVETSFGYHVIRLVERRPAESLSLAEKRARLADDIFARRARREVLAQVAERRAVTKVEVLSSAETDLDGAFAR